MEPDTHFHSQHTEPSVLHAPHANPPPFHDTTELPNPPATPVQASCFLLVLTPPVPVLVTDRRLAQPVNQPTSLSREQHGQLRVPSQPVRREQRELGQCLKPTLVQSRPARTFTPTPLTHSGRLPVQRAPFLASALHRVPLFSIYTLFLLCLCCV